jgi:hypothetical protein
VAHRARPQLTADEFKVFDEVATYALMYYYEHGVRPSIAAAEAAGDFDYLYGLIEKGCAKLYG